MKPSRIFSIFLSIIITLVISACIKAERDNPYDPKSPSNPYYEHPVKMDKIQYNFGEVAQGQSSGWIDFYVYNKSDHNVWIAGIMCSNNPIFAINSSNIQPQIPVSLPPDAEIHFQAEFRPPNAGSFSGTVEVIYDSNSGPRIVMPVTGYGYTGGGGSTFWVQPGSFDFGNTPVNQASSSTFTINNDSENYVNVSSITVTSGMEYFAIYPSFSNVSMNPGSNLDFTVYFFPDGTGQFDGNISINYDGGALNIPVSGDGFMAPILVTPPFYAFPDTALTYSSSQTFVITNNSGSNVYIANIASSDTNAFSINPSYFLSGDIPNGESRTFEVIFAPTSDNYFTANINVVYNNTGGPFIPVPVMGKGGAGGSSGPLTFNYTSHDFGDIEENNDSLIFTFYVYNYSGQNVYINSINSDSSEFVIQYSPGSNFYLNNNNSFYIDVFYSPDNLGDDSGSIIINYNNTQSASLGVSGTGTAAYPYQYYVRQASSGGNDSNAGTSPSQPFATISHAVDMAQPGDKIAVAAGDYFGSDIYLNGEQLYGGFLDDGTWTNRDVDNETKITDNRTTGSGTYNDPYATIIVDGNSTYDTIIDGFVIVAGQYPFSCSIKINTDVSYDYTAVIKNNKIKRNDSMYSLRCTYGIFLRDLTYTSNYFDIIIDSNSIYGGDADGPSMDAYSNGIYVENAASSNIMMYIWNNTIHAGTVDATGTGNAESNGIYLSNISPYIYNNSIYLGDTVSTLDQKQISIHFEGSSFPEIINNLIFGNNSGYEYGIYDTNGYSTPITLQNNDFYAISPGALYHDDGVNITTLTSGYFFNGSDNIGSNNQSVNPSFDSSGDGFHLLTSSMIKTSGLDLSSYSYYFNNEYNYFTYDKDGIARTGNGTDGWSIGAYEQNN